ELRERAVRMVAEVRVQPHLATFPSAAASAVGQRMAPRDGRPLHRLERDHPGLPRPPPERELGQGFPPEPTHNARTISPPISLTVPLLSCLVTASARSCGGVHEFESR